MAKQSEQTSSDIAELVATEVTSIAKWRGTTFRPGIVYKAAANVRDGLRDLGVLKET